MTSQSLLCVWGRMTQEAPGSGTDPCGPNQGHIRPRACCYLTRVRTSDTLQNPGSVMTRRNMAFLRRVWADGGFKQGIQIFIPITHTQTRKELCTCSNSSQTHSKGIDQTKYLLQLSSERKKARLSSREKSEEEREQQLLKGLFQKTSKIRS